MVKNLVSGYTLHNVSELSGLSVISYSYRPHVVAIKNLSQRFIKQGVCATYPNTAQAEVPAFNNHNVRRVRALELCYIASGIFDACIDMRSMLRVNDIVASKLIVEEAGDKVTDGEGNSLSMLLDGPKE